MEMMIHVDQMLYDWSSGSAMILPATIENLYGEPYYVCQMSVSTHGP